MWLTSPNTQGLLAQETHAAQPTHALSTVCARLSPSPPVVYSELPALWGQDHLLFPFYTVPGPASSVREVFDYTANK